MAQKFISTFTDKILIPFRLTAGSGLTPDKLAFSVTIGIIAGIFPVLGTTTLLSLFLTLLFRQNIVIVQSVQWLFALLQIILIIPFMQFGAFLLNQQAIHISMQEINAAFQPGFISGIKTIGIFQLYAILSWTILAIPASAISYFTLKAVFHRKKSKS
jgi:uncharacterized protein (DUF2062 family)